MGRPLIAIDGPAGAGKSTVARRLAARLQGAFLDTGAMYRAYTLAARERGAPLDDPQALAQLVRDLPLEVSFGDPLRVTLAGEDVTDRIRTREVTQQIHHLASRAEVRDPLVARQRELAAACPGPVVAEGRDLGSVVFPDADLKVYLDATPDERARRRARDLDDPPPHAELVAEILERDHRDSTRAVAPLTRVPDALYLDCSELSLEQVVDRLASLAAL